MAPQPVFLDEWGTAAVPTSGGRDALAFRRPGDAQALPTLPTKEVAKVSAVAKAGATAKAQGIEVGDEPQAKTLQWTSKAAPPRGGIDGWDKASDMTVSKPSGKAPPLPLPLPKKEGLPRPSLPRPLGKGLGSAAKDAEMDEPTSKALPGGKGQAFFNHY